MIAKLLFKTLKFSKLFKEKLKSVRINQGLICIFNPNLGYDVNEFNKRAEKSDNHLDILPLH